MKKLLLILLLATAGAAPFGCGSKSEDAAPATAPSFTNQPITVSVTPQGGSTYNLSNSKATYAQYDAISILKIEGLLANGKTLSLDFGNTPGVTTAYQTNYLAAGLTGANATATTGRTVYSPGTKKVSGSFSCEFSDGTKLTGSFADAPLITR